MSPSVALRRRAHDALQSALGAKSEAEVREIVTDINAEIRDANAKGIAGPALMLVPYEVKRVVRDWREQPRG